MTHPAQPQSPALHVPPRAPASARSVGQVLRFERSAVAQELRAPGGRQLVRAGDHTSHLGRHPKRLFRAADLRLLYPSPALSCSSRSETSRTRARSAGSPAVVSVLATRNAMNPLDVAA